MRGKSQTKKTLLGVLAIAAFALLSPVVSYAQTTDTAGGTVVKPAPAPVDSTAVTSVGIGEDVTSVASDANGNIYASLQFTNKVVKLNGGGTEIASFAVGQNPTGLVVDNTNGVLYVLNNADNTVSKLGLDGTNIATYKVNGDGPVYAALNDTTLYIACERSNTLVQMSTDGVALGSTEVGARPVWVAISPTGTKAGTSVYVSCNKADQVWKLSSAGAVLAKYNSGRGPFGIAINSSGQVLVACFWDGVVLRLDGATGAVLSKTAVGDGAAGMIAYGNVVAVVENGSNSITRLSAADGSVISSDKVDRSPLIGTATASALWVGCTGSGTIARRAL